MADNKQKTVSINLWAVCAVTTLVCVVLIRSYCTFLEQVLCDMHLAMCWLGIYSIAIPYKTFRALSNTEVARLSIPLGPTAINTIILNYCVLNWFLLPPWQVSSELLINEKWDTCLERTVINFGIGLVAAGLGGAVLTRECGNVAIPWVTACTICCTYGGTLVNPLSYPVCWLGMVVS